jgi:Rhodanese-like domain
MVCLIQAQSNDRPANSERTITPAKVDFDAYEILLQEAKEHRKTRRVSLDEFLRLSMQENTIILDTRSDSMYNSKHIKGAVHLNFSDFTQENLAKTIPSIGTSILIYCNNNFDGDQIFFASKVVMPEMLKNDENSLLLKTNNPVPINLKPVTMALNIPTYINLYGYGYRNLYELSELVNVRDTRIELEGTAVLSTKIK